MLTIHRRILVSTCIACCVSVLQLNMLLVVCGVDTFSTGFATVNKVCARTPRISCLHSPAGRLVKVVCNTLVQHVSRNITAVQAKLHTFQELACNEHTYGQYAAICGTDDINAPLTQPARLIGNARKGNKVTDLLLRCKHCSPPSSSSVSVKLGKLRSITISRGSRCD